MNGGIKYTRCCCTESLPNVVVVARKLKVEKLNFQIKDE